MAPLPPFPGQPGDSAWFEDVGEVPTDLIALKKLLSAVAISGAYSDLLNAPAIPSTPGQVGAEPVGLSAATSASIATKITNAVSTIVAGAPAAFDTLLEIANQLAADESGAAALAAVVATKQNASQVLAAIGQQATSDANTYATQAQANSALGLAALAALGIGL